jgi:hypothetical protein
MKEISLKRPAEKASKEVSAPSPRDNYPSFSIYDKAPEELMKCDMGCEMTAKIKLTSKDMHEGPNSRKSVGFDVISVMMNDKPAKKVQKSGATEYME